MILVIFSIEEPIDVEAIQPIIQAVVEDCRTHMSHLTEVKGFIAVDKAADEILAVVNSKESNGG